MIIQTFLSLIKINIDDYAISGERKFSSNKQYEIKKIRGIVEADSDENIKKFIRGDLDTMKSMLGSGNITNVDVQDKTFDHFTALIYKTSVGTIAEIEWLLNHGANVDIQNTYGESAIFHAIYKDDVDKVKLLLKYKADLNIKNKSGDTPIAYAKFFAKNTVIPILEEAMKKEEAEKRKYSQIFIRGDIQTMEDMMKSRTITNVDVQLDGISALMYNVLFGKTNEIEWLLGKTAKIDLKDSNGMSAIFFAIHNDDLNMVKLLLKFNPNLNIEDKSGMTPLEYAIKGKKKNEIISILEAAMKS